VDIDVGAWQQPHPAVHLDAAVGHVADVDVAAGAQPHAGERLPRLRNPAPNQATF
jgi:hypothetical protein